LQPRELPEALSFEDVYEWCRLHDVDNLAFYSLEKLNHKPEEPLYRKWQAGRDKAIVRDITQCYAAQQIRQSFLDADVRFLEVQGTKIKPLYPQSDWRTMSDIDFIIDPDNLPKATKLLEDLGYECHEDYPGEVEAHRPPNINVELHTEYFPEYSQYCRVIHSPFDALDEKGQCDLSMFYVYNLLHVAKHYFGGGCGIRRVLDVYYLNKEYGGQIDTAAVQTVLERANLVDFAAQLRCLAEAWFGEQEQDLPRNRMQRHILRAGLHGYHRNTQKYKLEDTLDKNARFPKLKYLFGRLLGSGKDLRTRYPVLQRHKLLYPFCWLHRALCALGPDARKRLKGETKTVMEIKVTED
jgi:hypothetical protein